MLCLPLLPALASGLRDVPPPSDLAPPPLHQAPALYPRVVGASVIRSALGVQ